MYISLKWVQNRIGLKNISLSLLCERLTLAGFEIEDIFKKSILDDFDFILDVSLTANRSDIFNVKGFTNELLSIFFKENIVSAGQFAKSKFLNVSKITKISTKAEFYVWENYIQKKTFLKNKSSLEYFDSCITFLSLESKEVEVKSSTKWLQKHLLSSNIIPVNNILDTINFVTFETGYPFFCFDLNKLKKSLNTSTISFSLRYASEDENFQPDSETIIKLSTNNILLCANSDPISLFGMVTRKDIEVDSTTTKILIYGGLFDPIKIRKASQSLGLRTESSIRLEKNLNFNGFEQAFIRLCFLFNVQRIYFDNNNFPLIHIINFFKKSSCVNYVENQRPKLKLEYKEVTNLLGSSELLNNSNILNILEALNFEILRKTENYCEVHVPFSREKDIEREVDLIEEIVRISGFTSFLSIVPSLEKVGKFSKLEKLKRFLRKSFIDLGFQEALHYSISINQSQQQVQLKNPIVPDSSSFRSNLLTQMIQKAEINKKQKNNIFEAFEIGRVYSVKNGNIIESELISGIFGGNLFSSSWNEDGKTINWFEAKGLINNIFNLLNIEVVWTKLLPKENSLLHPGRCAVLFSKDHKIGFFGQIHPTQAKINSLSNETFLFEFDIEMLKFLWEEQTIYTYKPYSLFPVSLVDLAFIKPNNISFKDIETKILEVGGPLLETINLFDYYSGAPIQQGYHNLGFKLKFRNFDRTLTNEEVDNIIRKIKNSLEKEFNILTRQ